jgi:hypothetical protein
MQYILHLLDDCIALFSFVLVNLDMPIVYSPLNKSVHCHFLKKNAFLFIGFTSYLYIKICYNSITSRALQLTVSQDNHL